MADFEYYGQYRKLQYQTPFTSKETSSCHDVKNILITVQKKKNKPRKKCVRKLQDYTKPTIIFHLSNFGSSKSRKHITKQASMPDVNKVHKYKRLLKLKTNSFTAMEGNICSSYSTKYLVTEQSLRYTLNHLTKISQPTFKVYRCQLTPNGTANCNNCCCSCNSDAMFEVMKDLYDCYKKRNCDNCNCILCCHLPSEKPLGVTGKPYPEINLETALKEVAMKGFALPEGKTESEKKLINNIRKVLGLPPEPISQGMRDKYTNAANTGFMVPLEGKTTKQKEKILRDLHRLGIPLPVGRTPSEQLLVDKIGGQVLTHSERASKSIQKTKRSGLLTTFEGKSDDQIQKILREQAMRGIPLPEGETASKVKLINKIRADLGLSPPPRTSDLKEKYANAAEDGILIPLEGKSGKEKERILRGLHERGIPLPEGRTLSEKVLINKILQEPRASSPLTHEQKMRKSKAEEQEKKLRDLAMKGISLPEGKTESEKKLLKKVRAELGLPPEPKTLGMRNKYDKAADIGLLLPLEGKSLKEKETLLRGLADLGIPLPKGRTPSESALIAKVKGEPRDSSMLVHSKVKKIDPSRILLSLEGKIPDEIEKILKKLAMRGIPLPEGQTASQKKIINKVRVDLGLPPDPKTPAMKEKHKEAAGEGLLLPLEGRSPEEKEIILQGLLNMSIPLPKGRTSSEKALIAKVRDRYKVEKKTGSNIKESEGPVDECICGLLAPPMLISLDIKRRAKAAEQLLEGKTPNEKEKILRGLAKDGIPLPKGKTASENKLILKIRGDLGLPPEPKTDSMRDKYEKAAEMNLLKPLQGQSPEEKERILRGLLDIGIQLPIPRTASEKSMIIRLQLKQKSQSEKIRRAKVAGLLTPLEGKTPPQQEEILRGLGKIGIPLPKGNTDSQNKLIVKIRSNLGLPPEPKNSLMRIKYVKAADAGFLQPLEGKTTKEKEKILRGLYGLGIPLPKARTQSEKALILKIQGKRPVLTPSEKMRGAKAAGFLTPLRGKTPAQRERILRGLAKHGISLPEGETNSEKDMINQVHIDLGLPPVPKTLSMREKYSKAADAGILEPLDGKTLQEKEKILRKLAEVGIPLPKARTASEKALIDKIKGEPRISRLTPSEKIRKAQSAGLLTSLKGKTPAAIENILRGLADIGIPLPEGKSASEKNIINKTRLDLGLPPEPKTPAMREKHEKAAAAGLLLPLEGKLPKEKIKILQGLADMGIPLPVGRTESEKSVIAKVKERKKLGRKRSKTPDISTTTAKLRRAKDAGLLTPLKGKSPEQKVKILKGLVKNGLLLPEGKTPSEKSLIDKIRAESGLPPTPKSPSMREKYKRAHDAGIMTPLEGKSISEKEKILRKLHAEGIPFPKGRTPSEKSLIKIIKTGFPGRKTPYEEMTPAKKEKILRGLIKSGESLPDAKTPSGIDLIKKVLEDMGLPPKPTTLSMKEKMRRAYSAGLITPLEGKTSAQKEKILRGLAEAGIPLPEGRTSSEKTMKRKIEGEVRKKLQRPSTSQESEGVPEIQPNKMKKAEELGLMTPLSGKSLKEKERILRGLAKLGLPLPEGTTPSDKQLIKNIRRNMGLPPEPETLSMKKRHLKAAHANVLVPLEGLTQAEKENILRSQARMGLYLPEGRTPSEKSVIKKIKEEVLLSKVPSKKLQKAKHGELLTQLKGKSRAEKEKIIRSRAKAGLPLPEGQTMSEKSLIRKIKSDFRIQPPSKEAARKAKEKGLFTPLADKRSAEKENILHGLAEPGIPLPEGETSKDKALINKVKDAYRGAKESGTRTRVLETKITKCERACGCDKKKIKFKHSYVKIKVTSPDMSSVCPCPDECIPSVKGGVFVDSQGVNVIIESAVGIPQFRKSCNDMSENDQDPIYMINDLNLVPLLYDIENKNKTLINSIYENSSFKSRIKSHIQDDLLDIPFDHITLSDQQSAKGKKSVQKQVSNNSYCNICPIGSIVNHDLKPNHEIRNLIPDVSNHLTVTTRSSQEILDSMKIIKCETSLSLSSSYEEVSSSSVISFAASAPRTKSSTNLFSFFNVAFNNSASVESEILTNGVECCTDDTITRSQFVIQSTAAVSTDKNTLIKRNQMPDDVFQAFPMSSTNPSPVNETKLKSICNDKLRDSVIIITNLNSNLDVTSVIDDLLKRKEFSEASSLFVVVPTSDEENEIRATGLGLTQCVQLSENSNKWKNAQDMEPCTACARTSSKIQKLRKIEKPKFLLENLPTTILSSITLREPMYNCVKNRQTWLARNKVCQITTPNAMFQRYQGVSTDTTQDRPCCCAQPVPPGNVMSEVITPVYNRGLESDNFSTHKRNNTQQASLVSIIHSPVSINRISECLRHPGCQSPEQIQYPIDSPTPRHLKYFKKLLQRNLSPHTMNKILREINTGHLDRNSLDESNGSPELTPEKSLLAKNSVTPINENYFICHQQKSKKGKSPKWAVNSSKTVKIDAVCDCNHKQSSFMTIQAELKAAKDSLGEQCCNATSHRKKAFSAISKLNRKHTAAVVRPNTLVSIGVQDSPGCILCLSGLPCTSEHEISGHVTSLSNISHRTPVNIYGHSNRQNGLSPLRSYAAIGSGGIYTHCGSKHMPHRIDTGVGADFRNTGTDKFKRAHLSKQVQKNSNDFYKKSSRETVLGPESLPRYLSRDDEGKRNNIILMKPNLTQTTSRVQFDERSLVKSPLQPSWTIEDLIRYYASFKPEVLKTLLSLTSVKKTDEKNITHKENRNVRNSTKGESSGFNYLPENSEVPVKEPRQQESRAFTGFKIKKPGGNIKDDFTPLKRDLTQQASFLSISTISRCEILPCVRSSCHTPEQILQYPFGTPMSESLEKLKKLVQLNCSPEKVKYFLEQMEAGNESDINFEEAMKTEDYASGVGHQSDSEPARKPNCRFPPCEGHPGCHSVEQVLEYPFGTPLPPNLVKLKELLEQNCSRKKVKFLFDQVEAGKDIDWEDTMEISTDPSFDVYPSLGLVSSQTTNSRFAPCQGHPGFQPPDKVLQYPFSTPLSPEFIEKIIEQNNCPERIKHLFAEIATRNMKNVHWAKSAKTPAGSLPNKTLNAAPATKVNCQLSPCQEHPAYHPPDEISQHPFTTSLSPDLIELKNLIERNDCPKNVKHLFAQLACQYMKNFHGTETVTTPTPCPPDICKKHPNYHSPNEITPLSPELLELKEIYNNVKEQDDYPEKVKQIFDEMEVGHRYDVESQELVEPTNLQSDDCLLSAPKLTTMTCRFKHYQKLSESPKETSQHTSRQNENNNSKQMDHAFKQLDTEHSRNITCSEYTQPSTQFPSYRSTTCVLPSCHLPDEILQYPYGTPLPPHLVKLKELLETNSNPQKVKELFQQIETGNFGCLDLGGAIEERRNIAPESNSEVLPCRDPISQNYSGCHLPDEVLQYPYDASLSQSPKNLKVLDQNNYPQKVKELYEEIQDGNLCNLECEGVIKRCSDLSPNNYLHSDCHNPSCQKNRGCHLPDEVLQYPYGTPLSQPLVNLKKVLEQTNNPNKVKELYKQMEDGNLCNLDLEETVEKCSYLSPNNYPNSDSHNPSCQKNHGCHLPDEVLQYPYGTPLSQSLVNLKKVLEQTNNPKKVKKLFKQMEDGNLCNLDLEEAVEKCSDLSPNNYPNSDCHNPSCQKNRGCHLPDEVLQYPYGTPLSQSLANLKKVLEQTNNPKKVKELYKQIEDENLHNLDWEGAVERCSGSSPNNYQNSDCHNPSCQKDHGCHLPDEVLQYPYGTPLSQSLVNLKKVVEQNKNPKKVKKLYKNIEDGNLCNLDWEGAIETYSDLSLDDNQNSNLISCRAPCQKNTHCHLAREFIQYPYGTPLPQQLVRLKTFLEQNSNPKEVRDLFGQIEAGNLKNSDCVEALKTLTDFSPDNYSNSESLRTISTCHMPPCQGHPNCHSPDEILQYPFGTPLPEHLVKLKNLLEENNNPRKVKELFKQMEAGNLWDSRGDNMKNTKNVGCGETMGIPIVEARDPSFSPSFYVPPCHVPGSIFIKPSRIPRGAAPLVFPPGVSTPGIYPPGVSHPVLHPPMIPIVCPPEAYAPPPKDEDCATCRKPKYKDGIKMKCACSGKRKKVKIKPCPCEVYKVPISREEPGLKIATRSYGAQCCICDDYKAEVKKSGKNVIFKLGQSAPSIIGMPGGPVSTGVQGGTGCIKCPTGLPCSSEHTTCPKLTTITISPIPLGYGQPDDNAEMGELEIIGPQGGYVMIGPDGIYTQSGIKVIKFSTGAGTDAESNNVGAETNSKKKKNCLCLNKRGKKKRKVICQCPSEPDIEPEPLLLYTYEDFEEARKQSKQYKSDLTQTTSGFKFDKKKRPEPVPEPEYTVEDAIRDYAALRPDFIRSLVPQEVKPKNKIDCLCEDDVGVGQYEILKSNDKRVIEPEKVEPLQQDIPLKGLKLSIGGKGSGSKGLSGICCFEMYQDS